MKILRATLATLASLLAASLVTVAGPARASLQVATDAPTTAPAASPHPDEDTAMTVALALTLVGFGAADVGFAVSDAVHAGRGTVAARGVSYAEIDVAVPQVVAFNFLETMLAYEGRDREVDTAALLVVPGITDSLLVHGAMAASLKPGTSQATLYGVPWAVGFDAALTFPALFKATRGRLDARALGVVEAAATAPQVAAFSYAIAKDPRSPAWIGMTAWSSSLFVHGLVSAVTARPEEAELPPPPPAPPKRPLLVPDSVRFAPAPVTGGLMLTVGGKLY